MGTHRPWGRRLPGAVRTVASPPARPLALEPARPLTRPPARPLALEPARPLTRRRARPFARLGIGTAATALTLLATMATATPSAGAQPNTWNFTQIGAAAAQVPGRYGAGVTVAVVDTWVDGSHPDFGGRVVDEADCVGGNGACRDHITARDACVHGTHVAGTVASATYGVAPQARILSVRVLSYDSTTGDCGGSTGDVAAGIRFAVTHGAQVINMSLGDLVPGIFQSSDITAAVHSAAAAGVLVVIAAGNSSVPITDSYGSDAMLIAATGPDKQLATYSDRNGSVALAAPGGDDGAGGLAACDALDCIASTLPGNRYGLLEGTSMAAPHVSGVAALLISEVPTRGRADVIHSLESTAQPLAGAGSGRLDASAALALRKPSPLPSSGSSSQTRGPTSATIIAPSGTPASASSANGAPSTGSSGSAGAPTTARHSTGATSKTAARKPTGTTATGRSSAITQPRSPSAQVAAGTGTKAGGHSGGVPAWAALVAIALILGSGTGVWRYGWPGGGRPGAGRPGARRPGPLRRSGPRRPGPPRRASG